MFKPNNYDDLNIDEAAQLPPGGYICKIKNIKETRSKAGNLMLVIELDISEGEYTDFFSKRFNRARVKNASAAWPNGGTKYIPITYTDGNASVQFKKFIVCTEQSNNFRVDWGSEWTQLINRVVGVTFRREEFIGNNGPAFAVKIFEFATTDDIRKGVPLPKDKLLEKTPENDEDLPF